MNATNLRTMLAAAILAGLGCAAARGADLGTAPSPLPDAPSIEEAAPARVPFFVRVGGSAVLLDVHASPTMGGRRVPGGGVAIGDAGAFYAEAGVELGHGFALSASGGNPPTLTARGTGTLAPKGKLFSSMVGLPVVAATYHFDGLGPFRPYVGVGVGYAFAFTTDAGSVAHPHMSESFAPAFVVGADYAIDDRWGVFVDVKKLLLRQDAHGWTSPAPGLPAVAPVGGRVSTDPLLVNVGVSYRF